MLDTLSPPINAEAIANIAANSALARVAWRDRGRAPLGYIKGMAVMFAVVASKLAQGDPAASEMAKAVSSDSGRDALAHYASRFATLGMRNGMGGIDTLRHLFALMIGLGMRESSGRYCEGYDREPNRDPLTSESAEAGLFQMSWNARSMSPFIQQLFDDYQRTGGGYKSIFAEGVTPTAKNLENVGSGDGLRFQQICKEMPGFAVEAAAVGLRNRRTHWGPINRHEAELRPEADEMLQQVQRALGDVMGGVEIPPFDRPVAPTHGTLWLQQSLNKLGAIPPLDEDGIAGRNTMAALSQFQHDNGLDVTGIADGATVAAIDRKLRPTTSEGGIPAGPNELAAWLERLVALIERLQAQRTTAPTPGSPQTDQLRKALDLLNAILVPGADGKSPPLGQVNGALGETLGKLLNGKKTAIGIIGAALTSVLSNVPTGTGLGDVLGMLTPSFGLSPFATPIFLAMSAWGVLGKFEKWSHGTAPPPRIFQ